jgi:hypothetical protein
MMAIKFCGKGIPGPTGATGPTLPILGVGQGSILLNNPAGSTGVYYSDLLTITNGPASINVSADILPSQDLTYSLGSASHRFESIHVGGGTVYIGNESSIGTISGIPEAYGESLLITGDLELQ